MIESPAGLFFGRVHLHGYSQVTALRTYRLPSRSASADSASSKFRIAPAAFG
jgi:hypothetical protein